MSEFQGGTILEKPDELTKNRYINPNHQICKDDAHKLAKDNDVVWGAE